MLSREEFDRLCAVGGDDEKFERERARVINNYIATLPADRQAEARSFQAKLDVQREHLGTEKFVQYLHSEINENLENARDLAETARVLAEQHADSQPRLDEINTVISGARWFTKK